MIRSGVESVGWGAFSVVMVLPHQPRKKVGGKTTAKEANLCFLLCVLPFLDVVWCGSVVVVVVSGTSIVLLRAPQLGTRPHTRTRTTSSRMI